MKNLPCSAWKRALVITAAALPWTTAGAADPKTPAIYLAPQPVAASDVTDSSAANLARLNEAGLGFRCTRDGKPLPAVMTGQPDLVACRAQPRVAPKDRDIDVHRLFLSTDPSCRVEAQPKLKIEFKEESRASAFSAQLRSILDFVLKKSGATTQSAQAGVAVPVVWCTATSNYAFKRERSTLTVSAWRADVPAATAESDALATLELITGPAEHLFVSGDALLSGANQVAWDATSKTLVSRDKPQQLYVGINYMLGDIYARHDSWARERVTFKLLLQPTKKPFDSYGLGVGYRFADGIFNTASDQGNSGFMLFGAVMWTRNDALDANGAVVGGKRERSVRVGVSYSLDALMGWLKD